MKASKHVANTWLLAQMIHPVIFFICHPADPDLIIPIFAGAVVCSIPSLLLSMFLIQCLPAINAPHPFKYMVWMLLVFFAIAINLSGIALLLGDPDVLFKEWEFLFPSLIAAFLGLLIRYKQFDLLLTIQALQDEN